MNQEIIYNFKGFLGNKGYSLQTIHIYVKALENTHGSYSMATKSNKISKSAEEIIHKL